MDYQNNDSPEPYCVDNRQQQQQQEPNNDYYFNSNHLYSFNGN
jgi:hypothetical protein